MLFWRGVEVFMQRVLTFKVFVYLRLTQNVADIYHSYVVAVQNVINNSLN